MLRPEARVGGVTWVDGPVVGDVLVQCSAHGTPRPATLVAAPGGADVHWRRPERRVAPGQSVVFYDATDRFVLGGGIAA
jgi:tRNA-specific 2-thiouridylase